MWKLRDVPWLARSELRARWKVTALFVLEPGIHCVRLHCFGGPSDARVIHVTEARMLRRFVPIYPKPKKRRR